MGGVMEQTATEGSVVSPCGDAQVLITAPFYVDGHVLERTPEFTLSPTAGQPVGHAFIACDSSFTTLFQGTLTYDQAQLDVLELEASDAFLREFEDRLLSGSAGVVCEAVRAILFPDGYGSISVHFSIRDGWDKYLTQLPKFSSQEREDLCAAMRPLLVRELNAVVQEFSDRPATDVTIPYFNMTYSGDASVSTPGRAVLAQEFRRLVYPDSPQPLRSSSPWDNQFFYAGFAFFFLLGDDPSRNLAKFGLLLMILNVLYSRLARTSGSAREALTTGVSFDVEWLESLSEKLRAEYQDLVSPTFSFDHHALCLRDGIARAWDMDKLNASAEDLLDRVKQKLAIKNAQVQERRNRWLKGGLGMITVLSLVSALEDAVALWERWF